MNEQWQHAPVHHLTHAGTYFVTAATYRQLPIYKTNDALTQLQTQLFEKAREHDVSLQAWALFPNHYHLVAQTNDGAALRAMLQRFHSEAAISANARDSTPGRRVWFQYWDKELTFEASWLARLRYTHENAVHHGFVRIAAAYKWCSARWFEVTAPSSLVKTVGRMKIDRINVIDL